MVSSRRSAGASMTARGMAFASVVISGLAACQAPTPPDPTGRADVDMKRVLIALAAMNPKPLETLSPEAARLQPSAAMAALRVQVDGTGSAAPLAVAQVRDIEVPGAAGLLPARLYNARIDDGRLGAMLQPVILYFQGGGWVIADLDTYDASARALAAGTGAIVVSVQTRKGPEHRFPAAHDDAVAAYRWLTGHAGSLGGDTRRIAIAGESAGGNLAIATAIAARDLRLPAPVALLSVYPVAGTSLDTLSAREHAETKPLNTAQLAWFMRYYTNGTEQEKQDTRLNLIAADLRGLPPTTVIMASLDPLRSGDEQLVERLRAAGVEVTARTYPSVTHEFFGMGSVIGRAKTAEDFAAAQLQAAFAPDPSTPAPGSRGRRRPGT